MKTVFVFVWVLLCVLMVSCIEEPSAKALDNMAIADEVANTGVLSSNPGWKLSVGAFTREGDWSYYQFPHPLDGFGHGTPIALMHVVNWFEREGPTTLEVVDWEPYYVGNTGGAGGVQLQVGGVFIHHHTVPLVPVPEEKPTL